MSIASRQLLPEGRELETDPMTVREAVASDETAWEAFLATQPSASFYHLFGWREIVRSSLSLEPHCLIASRGGRVVGVLPLVLVSSRLFGRILCSVPFLNYGGPCAESDDIASVLVRGAVQKADALEADYVELRCAAPVAIDLPASLRKISMTLALDPDPERVMERFTPKHRRNIRRAYKNEFAVHTGGRELLVPFYTVLERSWRDLGTPLYECSYFKKILETFPDKTRIFVCCRDDRPVSVAFNGYFNGTVEGMWAGALPVARDLQANYVLYWEMIQDACIRGLHTFHLGRSSANSGSEQFKSRWNADTRQLYWYFYRPDGGPMPQLNVENPRYRLAIQAWRRLPIWVVRQLGPGLARSIP